MDEFQVGNRVRVNGDPKDDSWNGRYATIASIVDGPWPYEVEDVSGDYTYLKGYELTLDESPAADIYIVNTSNIDDTLYYATRDDAFGFIGDQINMGFYCTIDKKCIAESEAQRLFATMD